MSKVTDAVVGLGSNLGDRAGILRDGARQIAELGRVTAVSGLYETPPVGPPQPDYLNAALRLWTPLDPFALLSALQAIEEGAGRQRSIRWGARTLDLDLLWADGLVCDGPNLTLPHPRLHERAFALLPLLDVAPEAADPSTGVRYHTILAQLGPAAAQGIHRVGELDFP